MTGTPTNRDAILACALDLIADRGYHGVGVEEIATCAGVTKPTLYHYFGNKQGVLETLVASRYDPFLEDLAQAAAYRGDLPQTLTNVVNAFIAFGLREPKLYRMALAAELTAREDRATRILATRMATQHAILAGLFERASRDHGNMRGKHRVAAATLNATIAAYLRLSAEGALALDEGTVWQLIQQFSHGIYS